MNYTQQEFEEAEPNTNEGYSKLKEPKFEGQTRAGEDGEYKMYFSAEGKLYSFTNNITNIR